ncbi:ecotropic viral integration site 5 ortholog-like [Tubulanus polymorphus]|uniref:ecotropic viral integration site 5 ortholog-like n=1 Tax=Tubulanus polymorphus TaxID=672921 RepID=UPI003DA5B040
MSSCEQSPLRLPATSGKEQISDTEIQLLAKLEAANRLLEADEKSLKSLSVQSNASSHSRKDSLSSVLSNNSVNSHVSNLTYDEDPVLESALVKLSTNVIRKPRLEANGTEDSWVMWGRIINDWDSYSKRKSYVRDLVRKGIPYHFRGLVWQLLCNAHNHSAKDWYPEFMKKTSPFEKVIRRDIARTYPEHDFFKEKDGLGQESLFNVMKAYSLYDREVGYCQGSGFIVGLLLMQMPEEEAFACLVCMMQDYKLRDLFKPGMAELGLCMFKLECLIQEQLPDLYLHFQSQCFHTSMYASSWFLTLFTTALPLSISCRIMDLFLSEGMEIVFKVALAILVSSQEDLLALDMEGMITYIQKDIPAKYEGNPENLVQLALTIKYSVKKLKRLEKEYNEIKSREHEDQVELRRLRTENRLLKQRIENLEKETAQLADRLVQDQLARAQQAEMVICTQRTLSLSKMKEEDMISRLSEAQEVIQRLQQEKNNSTSEEDQTHAEKLIRQLSREVEHYRMKDAASTSNVKELTNKIKQLEQENDQLQREPCVTIVSLQEELIAGKLREAEATLSMKEMSKKLKDYEEDYQRYMELGKSGSKSKTNAQQLQDELILSRLHETQAASELRDMKQKVMELETQNQICTHQIHRLDTENMKLKSRLTECDEREREYKNRMQDNERKLADLESKRKEESMMVRIKDAEHTQTIAEMRQRIAELEIETQELVTAGQIQQKDNDLENRIADLQDEVLQLKMNRSLSGIGYKLGSAAVVDSDTDSNISDFDGGATISNFDKYRLHSVDTHTNDTITDNDEADEEDDDDDDSAFNKSKSGTILEAAQPTVVIENHENGS